MDNLRAVALRYAHTLPKPEDLEGLYDSSDARRTLFGSLRRGPPPALLACVAGSALEALPAILAQSESPR